VQSPPEAIQQLYTPVVSTLLHDKFSEEQHGTFKPDTVLLQIWPNDVQSTQQVVPTAPQIALGTSY
jgi:hypothetical protein